MCSDNKSALHPSLKLNYFHKVGWEPGWIEMARNIVQVEYQHSYKGQYDKELLVHHTDSRPTTLMHITITLKIPVH